MFDKLKKAVSALEKVVGQLDPETLESGFALELVRLFSRVEKLGAAGKALAACRVASSGDWKMQGDRSPAHLVSRATGDSVGASVAAIETASRMSELPMASKAFRSGELTPAQASEVAQAASASPCSEGKLLKLASTEGIAGLRTEARRVMAAAIKDEAEHSERLHRSRYLRTFTESDGAFRIDARLTPEAGAEFKVALGVLRERVFQRSRQSGLKESYQALDADALLEMARTCGNATGVSSGPKAVVNIRVDYAALKRGHTKPGDVCEVPGVGPISVSAAQALASDAILKVLLVKGAEVKAVANYGRTIDTRTRAFLNETYTECVVRGCHETNGLEIDHVIPLGQGPSSPENLVRICKHHHRLKTFKRFTLGPRKEGRARLLPPKAASSRASPSR